MLIKYGLTREELEKVALQACPAEYHYDLADCLEEMPDEELIDIAFGRVRRDCLGDDTAAAKEVPEC